MTSVNEYRIYCETEHAYVYAWGTSAPTLCPNNTADTIDPTQTTIVDVVSTDHVVTVKEELIPTQGFYRCKGFTQNITNATVGSTSVFQMVWPYRVSLLEGWFFVPDTNYGDLINAQIGPLPIGAITAPVSIGDTTISVSPTVVPNVALGFMLSLSDGASLANLGEIVAIGDNTVTVATASTAAFSPLTPTYVLLTIPLIDNMPLNSQMGKFTFATKKIGGKSVPPNVPLSLMYTNLTGGAKTFSYTLEILY